MQVFTKNQFNLLLQKLKTPILGLFLVAWGPQAKVLLHGGKRRESLASPGKFLGVSFFCNFDP